MKTMHRYLVLLVILPLIVFLGSCAKTAENEHLPEYCQTYSGFMSTASKDLYDLIGNINRTNYLSAISEIELDFELDDPNIEVDLDGIQCFQNLTSLTLTGRSFKDISPISALKNIQKISLINTSIVSIDSFKNLSKVNELTIYNTKTLQSVDGVEEMTKLTRLDLSDNGIVNIDGLNNLVNLTELILVNNEITYFPSINQLNQLEILDVSNNNIEQLGEDLSGLSNLERFIAKQNNICDLSTLDDLTSLKVLDLSENDLGCGGEGVSPDFSSLLNAPLLKEIYLNDNNLTSIEDLRGKVLPLEILHLENNKLTDITPIANYTGIEELVLFNNNITNIDDLSGMINVTEIDLSDNSIIDFTDLLEIPNLKDIDLSGNNIAFIPDISGSWPQLVILDLDSNNITDTSGVEGHSYLQTLILSNNGMTELSGISNLPELHTLIMFQEIPDIIPEDFVYENNPNNISVIRDSFNALPELVLTDETTTFDFGFELGSSVSIINSINDNRNIGIIDFSDMDIDVIDANSINLLYLKEINISGNNISDISFILGNPSLQIIDISGNPVENLSVIKGNNEGTSDLDNLDQVNASYITTSNDLVNAFIDLPELSYIDLTGSNVLEINNCFNGLDELTYLGLDSPELERIIDSFNDLYAVYTDQNIISFSNSKIGEIRGSFNNGLYEQIAFQNNNPGFPETIIIDSFNGLDISHSNSIYFYNNDFRVVEGSFNNLITINLMLAENNIMSITDSFKDTTTENLFLGDNDIELITTSFVNLDVLYELNLKNNKLETIVGLNSVISVTTINLSNNVLTTVDFLDGITGVESLNISNQFDVVENQLTLTVIDGINNMPFLSEVVMNTMLITEIDGFKNIGIEEFILSRTDNNNGFITSITSDSFSNSVVTNLDLEGHNLQNIDFLTNFDALTDLSISINTSDLSGFQGVLFRFTLDSLTLENTQEVTDFSYLSDFDTLTFFSFSSDLTYEINNFDGLDLLTNSNFKQKADITSISGSFNDMDSLTLTNNYIDIFPSLSNISGSFNMYEVTDDVIIGGDIAVVNSFTNVGELALFNTLETVINFDSSSFTNIHTFTALNSNYDSHSFLNGYQSLENVVIGGLLKNITDLENDNITSLEFTLIDSSVVTIDIDIFETGIVTLDSNDPVTLTVFGDNTRFVMSMALGEVVLEIDNINSEIDGQVNILTVNSTNLVFVDLANLVSTTVTFNTDALNQVIGASTVTNNADNLYVNSLSPTISIDVNVDTLNITDNLATTYDIDINTGDATIVGNTTDIVIDFFGTDLFVGYDTLETVVISGNINNLIIASNSLDDIDLSSSVVSDVNLTSEQAIVNVLGGNITTLHLNDDNIADATFTSIGTDIVLISSTSNSILVDIEAETLDLVATATPSVEFDTTSSLSTLDLTDGTSIGTLIFNNANIPSIDLVTAEASLTASGSNISIFNITANNLTTIDIDAINAYMDIDTSTTTLTGQISGSTVEIGGTNLTGLTFTGSASIFNVTNSPAIEILDLDGMTNINNLNISSDALIMDLSAVNALETALSGDNYIGVITDVGTNNLDFTTVKTTSMSFDIIASGVDLTTALDTISFSNSTIIDSLGITSNTLSSVTGGSGTFTTIDITESSSSLYVAGSNIAILNVDVPIITTFTADVDTTTDVNFDIASTDLCTINTTSEDISISSGGDINLTSAFLTGATIEILSDNATLNLSRNALDFTLNGTMGDAIINSTTMNNFIVGTGLSLDLLDITNDNITSLDLSPGTISNLSILSTGTTMDILGDDLVNIDLNMNNLNNVTLNSTNTGAVTDIETGAVSISLNGVIDSVNIIGNTLAAADLNGTIDNVDIVGSILSNINLDEATYTNLVLTTDILSSLDTLSNVSNSLEISSTIDDFDLTSNTPTVIFNGDSANNLFITTIAVAMDLETTNDSITLDGATTDFTISGINLNGVNGTAETVDLSNQTGTSVFTFDLDATSVTFDSNQANGIGFNGVRTIPTINITSDNVTGVSTHDVVITTLNYNSTGTHTTLTTKAAVVNHTNGFAEIIEFIIDEDSQVFNTNSELVTMSTITNNSATLNYNGVYDLNINLNDLTTTTLNINTVDGVVLNGTSVNVILSGATLTNINTTSDPNISTITMNGTLVNDLEFISAGLLANLTDITIDSLLSANVGSIINKLQGTTITLTSPITSQDIYDYYYDEEYIYLSDLEANDSARYDGFKDPLIADALAKIRENTNFQYTDDAELTEDIDLQVYETTQYYFDAYVAGELTTEEQMVIDFGQTYVNDIKAAITATLGDPVLVIVEATIEANVITSIENDSDIQATTDSGNITFTIG